nr:PREDICTED: DNA ligase 1-like [Stegastes partitus]
MPQKSQQRKYVSRGEARREEAEQELCSLGNQDQIKEKKLHNKEAVDDKEQLYKEVLRSRKEERSKWKEHKKNTEKPLESSPVEVKVSTENKKSPLVAKEDEDLQTEQLDQPKLETADVKRLQDLEQMNKTLQEEKALLKKEKKEMQAKMENLERQNQDLEMKKDLIEEELANLQQGGRAFREVPKETRRVIMELREANKEI